MMLEKKDQSKPAHIIPTATIMHLAELPPFPQKWQSK